MFSFRVHPILVRFFRIVLLVSIVLTQDVTAFPQESVKPTLAPFACCPRPVNGTQIDMTDVSLPYYFRAGDQVHWCDPVCYGDLNGDNRVDELDAAFVDHLSRRFIGNASAVASYIRTSLTERYETRLRSIGSDHYT